MIWTIIFSVVLIAALIYLIFFLKNKNKVLDEELEKRKQRIIYYRDSLEKLNEKNPGQEDLEALNKIARDFFNEKFELKYSLTYLELAEEFSKKNMKNEAEFCKEISNMIFSGKKIKPEKVKEIIEEFENIIHSSLEI